LHCRQLVGTGEKQTAELRMLRLAGLPFFARLESVADRAGAARATRFLLMISDITERKQAEEILRQARAELEQRVRERTQELTRTNTELRAEKAFSDSLIELAPAVVAVIDGQGNLMRTNAYGELLAGYRFAETQGRNMIDLVVPAEDQPRVRQLLQDAAQGRAVQALVVPVRSQDGSIRQIEWSSKPLADAGGEPFATLVIGHDITEHLRARQALQFSEAKFRGFVESASDGIVVVNQQGLIVLVNAQVERLLGYRPEELSGQPMEKLVPERYRAGHAGHFRSFLGAPRSRPMGNALELFARRKDGSEFPAEITLNPVSTKEGLLVFSAIRDITDRVNLEHEVLNISEHEQRRIAQDLHDGLGQLLAGARYLAATLRQDLAAKSPADGRKAGRILEVLAEAGSQTRDLARGLHPVAAEPIGLMVALEALAARTQKLFKLECHFRRHRPVLIQDNTLATHLFRIAQESVTNAIKHGKPRRVEISLTGTPDRIVLAVRDDGKGMPARPRAQAGMGLRIMRYRASMIGGALTVQKAAGGGTKVVCTVDLSGVGGPPQSKHLKNGKAKKD
jgi:PAS domain S-box-containing protein